MDTHECEATRSLEAHHADLAAGWDQEEKQLLDDFRTFSTLLERGSLPELKQWMEKNDPATYLAAVQAAEAAMEPYRQRSRQFAAQWGWALCRTDLCGPDGPKVMAALLK